MEIIAAGIVFAVYLSFLYLILKKIRKQHEELKKELYQETDTFLNQIKGE